MSVTATAASASAALPVLNLHPHGHKKGVHGDSGAQANATGTTGPTTTQGLFGNLLESLEQVIGINTTTAASAAAAKTDASAANAAAAANGAVANGAASSASIGARIDTKV